MASASLLPDAALAALYGTIDGRRQGAAAAAFFSGASNAAADAPLAPSTKTTTLRWRGAVLGGPLASFAPSFASPSSSSSPLGLFPAHRAPLVSPSSPAFGASPLSAPVAAYQAKERQELSVVLRDAGKRALGGGIPGAAAMALQVLSLMWLRTTINYQYRYGMTTGQALKKLYGEGGVRRFYRGLGPALIQGPLSRFGDTAANAGMLALLENYDSTRDLPVGVKTMCASLSAGAFRIFLMPVDALKTIMQVEGKNGVPALAAKVRANGPGVLYHGALAASAATFAGHAPWFFTYNYLNEKLPQYDDLPKRLGRSAVIGFCASAVSDTISNSIRVVKTTRQTATVPMPYVQVVKSVVAEGGVLGLFGRGLKTKILANGLQGLMFSVLWRIGQDYWNKREADKDAAAAVAAAK